MLELYLMALCRGIPFTKYVEESTKTGSPVKLALDVLNSDAVRPHFKGRREDESHVTVDTLFRGTSAGDRDGQYLSQFLLLPRPPQFPSGCAPNIANAINAQIFFKDPYLRYLHPPSPSEREFMVTWGDYISVSNGGIPKKYEDSDFNGMAEIDNGRKLASLVHVDSLYEEYAYALDVLAGLNHPRSKHSPYHRDNPTAVNEGDGPTLGIPDAAGLIGAVALEAARAAWVQKWIVARRARPEVMAAYIHQIASDPTFPVKLHSIVSSPNAEVEVLYDAIRDHNMRSVANAPEGRTLLLSQVFPEGAPGHPAWPSGHATIAGACVTVLKAIFDDEVDFEVDGQNYNLGRELDKLASNVAFGRSFAGVHYRSDGEHGIVLGEAVALRFLQDHLRTYREDFEGCGSERCFELTKRNGERVRITTSVISASNAADGTVPFSTTIDPAMRKHPTTAL
jgi:membrane-associated phospholipid phosphatase